MILEENINSNILYYFNIYNEVSIVFYNNFYHKKIDITLV